MYVDEVHRKSIQKTVTHMLGLASSDMLVRTAEVLLKAYENYLGQKVDSSRLGRLNVLFEAARVMLECFAPTNTSDLSELSQQSITSTRSRMYGDFGGGGFGGTAAATAARSSPSSSVAFALIGLRDLRDQMEMHALFKEQRLKAMGWTWTSEDRHLTTTHDLVGPDSAVESPQRVNAFLAGVTAGGSAYLEESPSYDPLRSGAGMNAGLGMSMGSVQGGSSVAAARGPNLVGGFLDFSAVTGFTRASAAVAAGMGVELAGAEGKGFSTHFKRFVDSLPVEADTEVEALQYSVVAAMAQVATAILVHVSFCTLFSHFMVLSRNKKCYDVFSNCR